MSDLISRKAVLEEIRKIECEPGYQHVGEDWAVGLIIAENIVESAESIESTPSAEPERRWIPVTEALPNNEEYDWVLGQIRETDSGYLWIPRQVEYREIKDDWYEDSIGWLKKNPDHAFEVVAWMPLPEPYGGE